MISPENASKRNTRTGLGQTTRRPACSQSNLPESPKWELEAETDREREHRSISFIAVALREHLKTQGAYQATEDLDWPWA